MYSKAPLIYVWIGKKVPKWISLSLRITAKNNPTRNIVLLYDNFINKSIFKKYNISNLETFFIDDIYKDRILNSNINNKDSFWINTSLRFEVINKFVNSKKIKSFFHAECDNLLFNFDNLDKRLNQTGNGIFVPRDSIDRAIASFMYCNDNSCIEDILEKYSLDNISNDMFALGKYANTSNKFFSLPTESYKKNSSNWEIVSPEICGGIFDAAAIGQYCFGLDQKINRYTPTYNLFENEFSNINFKKLKIFSDGVNLKINLEGQSKLHKLFNLHVHSKDIYLANKFIKKNSIYNKVLLKQRIVTSNKFKKYFGFVIKIFDLLKFMFKKIILNNAKYFLSKLKKKYFVKNKEYISRISSFPFISGDSFMGLADTIILKENDNPVFIKKNSEKEIIFVENDLLKIPSVHQLCFSFKKVILHNGDINPPIIILKKLIHHNIKVYGTNLIYKENQIHPIPIGLENAYYKKNGDLNYFNISNILKIKKVKKKILLISFTVHNKRREIYIKKLRNYNLKNNNNMSLKKYREELASSYFVLSPPGNGIDCHRIWEAMYHKTVPVIERKYHLFDHLKLPILIVDKLEEFLEMSYEYKLQKYHQIWSLNYPNIYIDWWLSFIKN